MPATLPIKPPSPSGQSYTIIFREYIRHGVFLYFQPIYKDLKVKFKKESGEAFFRPELEGTVKFISSDFDCFMARPFDQINTLSVICTDKDKKQTEFYVKFTRAKCDIDLDNKIMETRLEVLDDYNDIIAALDKEYDLLTLGPASEAVTLYKRPVLQCYIPGEKIITSYINGVSWESECEPVTDTNKLKSNYGFSSFKSIPGNYVWQTSSIEDTVINNSSQLFYDEGSQFTGTLISEDRLLKFTIPDYAPAYSDKEFYTRETTNSPWVRAEYVDTLYDIANFTKRYKKPGANIYYIVRYYNPRNFVFRILCDNKADAKIKGEDSGSTFNGVLVKNNDSFGNSMNYRYAIAIDPDSFRLAPFFWARCSEKEGRFGQRQPQQFYRYPLLPSVAGLDSILPVSKSTWGDFSIWLNYDRDTVAALIDDKHRLEVKIRDAFTLGSCIKALLRGAGIEGIAFEETEEYSQFFYGPGYFNNLKLFMTQKTNATKAGYDNPAQKMPLTLKKLFEMLKKCFKVYWYIKDGKLKLEHITYFTNGESYYGTPEPVDFVKGKEPKTRKPWAFGKNKYSFNFEELPERIQFGWGDDCSEPFEGRPIEVLSNYVKEGQIEEVNVDGFAADIDMMICTPGNFSNDGIAMLATNQNNTVLYKSVTLKYTDYDDGLSSEDGKWTVEETYNIQNGFLSFAVLVPSYYGGDLPGSRVKINDTEYYYEDIDGSRIQPNVKRVKLQKLKCPVALQSFNPYALFKTELGTGQLNEMTYDTSSEVAEIQILHDTEK